jgi:hypothetical protein
MVLIVSQHLPELVDGQTGLREDGAEEHRTDRLAGVERHGNPAGPVRVLQLRVRPPLDDDHPAEAAEGTNKVATGDSRDRRHGSAT